MEPITITVLILGVILIASFVLQGRDNIESNTAFKGLHEKVLILEDKLNAACTQEKIRYDVMAAATGGQRDRTLALCKELREIREDLDCESTLRERAVDRTACTAQAGREALSTVLNLHEARDICTSSDIDTLRGLVGQLVKRVDSLTPVPEWVVWTGKSNGVTYGFSDEPSCLPHMRIDLAHPASTPQVCTESCNNEYENVEEA